MPVRSFDEDAAAASQTSLPVPRGIAFHYQSPRGRRADLARAQADIGPELPGWEIRAVDELPGWFEALAPGTSPSAVAGFQTPTVTVKPLTLHEFWERLRAVRDRKVGGRQVVSSAEPLLLVASPEPATEVEAERLALAFNRDQFGFWGAPYDEETLQAIATTRGSLEWHLDQMHVKQAWAFWGQKHVGVPGEGIVVGHPDTGYTDHPEVQRRFQLPGYSFLRDSGAQDGPDARDDLRVVRKGFLQDLFRDEVLQNPGHGTATASVIASESDVPADPREAYGVAPGAKILPLRASRSVIHFDFSSVGRAILHAVKENADVISMSLGGGVYSEFVRECIKQAHARGVIVISAAGNQLPATVFPAAFPEVIGVAATNPAGTPWRFSGYGRLVDIAAPGEDVWRAAAALDAAGKPDFSVQLGTGTSFATACVAGVAALWLSYHGRQTLADKYGLSLIPFAFQYLLEQTADKTRKFVEAKKHGAGIANADALLRADLPDKEIVRQFEQTIRSQPVNRLTFIAGLLSGGMGIADASDPLGQEQQTKEQDWLREILGPRTDALAEEFLARIAVDPVLLFGFQRWHQGQSLLPLLDRLLGEQPSSDGTSSPAPATLSAELVTRLEERRDNEVKRLHTIHRGALRPGVSAAGELGADDSGPLWPLPPAYRQLRAYGFDPSLETRLDTALVNQVTIPTRWENLEPGPVGEYLEVVDVDPASGCAYSPVDLNHPHVLGQDGLPPSEGDPQFHQQMVYAVAMNTIHRFEVALGRPIFWRPLRPWLFDGGDDDSRFTPEALVVIDDFVKDEVAREPDPTKRIPRSALLRRDRYVQRLRIYPHALREANAYYSPDKRALLFGYFHARDDDTGRHYPGGMVFSCLSHDIIAHETTHALLDGMHPYFNEPTNPDVWAFHEAFADIVALFQHFTYPEVLRHQIATTRGRLDTNNLLGQLAHEFGQATGHRAELRSALGKWQGDTWVRNKPDARALATAGEPHARGSILVAAVFDAFLALYNDRIADLLRIYTGGTGVLPEGRIHPDLVNRLANEAAQTADDILRICIRAMDYVPPIDITFGEFLRALVTADFDLSPTTGRKNRIALIDAFRSWGIYPRDVLTLSEDSLRWGPPAADSPMLDMTESSEFRTHFERRLRYLLPALEAWQPGRDRKIVFEQILQAQKVFHDFLGEIQDGVNAQRGAHVPIVPGLDLRGNADFSVANLRPARRVGPQGEFRTEMVAEIVQTDKHQVPELTVRPRGAATMIVDLRTWKTRYLIYKRLYDKLPDQPGGKADLVDRLKRQQAFTDHPDGVGPALDAGNLAEWLAATYACKAKLADRRRQEPFAVLHGGLE